MMRVTTALSRELERLSHSGMQLADPAGDIRDRDVLDADGRSVGTVADLLVQPDDGTVRLVEISDGGGLFGIGRKSRLVPIEVITGGDPRTVYVERTREEILATDEYRPTEGDAEEEQYAAVYAAYGITPYWNRPTA
jgi:sporulation protein YlmC with PRC-barrel domain